MRSIQHVPYILSTRKLKQKRDTETSTCTGLVNPGFKASFWTQHMGQAVIRGALDTLQKNIYRAFHILPIICTASA